MIESPGKLCWKPNRSIFKSDSSIRHRLTIEFKFRAEWSNGTICVKLLVNCQSKLHFPKASSMNSAFDPYRDLLDIQSLDRPPTHYDLLGIEQFASDRETIDDAAGERMAMLQELANSEHMDASQKLLNEVSAARRCLLDATKKIAYDEKLRSKQKRTTYSVGKTGGRRKKRRGQPVLPVGIALGIVVFLGTIMFLRSGGSVIPRNLIVEWPMSERQGAAITVDGTPTEFAASDPVNLNIPKGRHTVVFQRDGFKDIRKTMTFEDVTIRMKLGWVPDSK